jgi:hypothetical protein
MKRRRAWIIYCRKTRNVISLPYYRRRTMLRDLLRLNGRPGPGQYCFQLRVFDQDNILITKYPKIKLNELKMKGGEYGLVKPG